MSWYNSNWDYRVKITVDHTKVGSTLSDFPVYVDLSNLPSGFHTNVNQTDARDIRVTTADGTTELPREVVFYNSSTDTGELHFKAPSLSSSTDTDFYIYYGNTSATEPASDSTYGRNAVWSDYKAVYHMQENPTGTVTDSTGNTPFNANVGLDSDDLTTGKLGAGIKKDAGEYFRNNIGISFNANDDVTFQIWLYSTGKGTGANPGIWRAGNTSTGTEAFAIYNGTSRRPWIRWSGTDILKPTAGYQIPENEWILQHWVIDSGSSANFYANGSSQHTATHTKNTSAFTINNLGWQYSTPEEVLGTYDEVRFRSSVLSSTWISTEYNNQSSPSTFYTAGSQETGATEASSERRLYIQGKGSDNSVRGLYLEGASEPVEGWYNSNWKYRVKITVDKDKVGSTLTDFPVYVDLNDLPSDFHNNVKSDGGDIRVTRSDGTTECPREIVFYDAANDKGELHFKANSLSSTSDTDFYIYYGNANASDYATDATYGAENVWTNYKVVYHGSSTSDSSSNKNDLSSKTIGYSTTSSVDLSAGDEATVSYWADNVTSTGTQIIYEMSPNYNSYSDCFVGYIDGGNTDVSVKGNAGYNLKRSSVNTTSRYYEVDVFNMGEVSANEVIPYENGSAKSATQPYTANNTGNFGNRVVYIGSRGGSSLAFSGSIEEFRICGVARSSTWISTEYNNQSSPSTFYTVGSQESGSIEANSSRGLYIQGRNSDNSARGLYVEGIGISESSTRGLYISGYLSTGSVRNLYVSGSQKLSTSYFNVTFSEISVEANSERGLYITGSNTGASERNLLLEGKPVVSERDLYLSGYIHTSSTRDLFLKGFDTGTGERGLYTQGTKSGASERSLYVEGFINTSERGLYIKGMDINTSNRGLYIQGCLGDSSERGLYLTTYALGGLERDLYTWGWKESSSARGVYLFGKDEGEEERGLYIHGFIRETGERGLYLYGIHKANPERGLYIQGRLQGASGRSIYTAGCIKVLEDRGLYVKGTWRPWVDKSVEYGTIYSNEKVPIGNLFTDINAVGGTIFTKNDTTAEGVWRDETASSTDNFTKDF